MLDGTGILVRALALRQFASIIGSVLLALILVIGVHPLDPDQLHAALHEINFANIAALVADLLTGLVTQPTTISTTAMAERQRIRGRRRSISACSVAFSRRTRSSSGALVDRQVVLDVERRVPAAVRLGHLGPPDRRG